MPTPAVFPALAVIAGTVAGVSAPGLRSAAAAALVLLVVLSAAAWRRERPSIALAATLTGLAAAGIVFGAIEVQRVKRPPLRAFFDDYAAQPGGGTWPLVVEGRLRADASPAEYGASMVLDVERVRTPCGWMPARGGARLAVSGTLAAGALDAWRAGRRLRLAATLRLPSSFRNPGARDDGFDLARRGIALVGSVKSAALVDVVARGGPIAETAAALRAYTRRTLRAAMPQRAAAAAIVTAILIGDRAGLDAAVERQLQEAGTYHVIAISGGNIAILAGLAFLLLRALRAPPRGGAIALAAVLCAYGYVAGGGPSVARATIAAAIYLLATAADHRSPALNVLATVALVAIVYEPLQAFDPGLWLSYGATLALLIAAARVWSWTGSSLAGSVDRDTRRGAEAAEQGGRQVGRKQPDSRVGAARRLRSAWGPARRLCSLGASGCLSVLAGTVAAELALFPVTASVFHRVTIAGLVLNFAAIPLMTVAQIAGMTTLLAAPLALAPARAAGWIAALASDGLTGSARLLDLAPWLSWRVPAPPLWILSAYYVALSLFLFVRRSPRARRGALAVAAGAALVIASPAAPAWLLPTGTAAARELRVTVLDVGQGDATVVQFPDGHAMLVDAAGLAGSAFDAGERVVTPALLALGVRRLDYLAITHGDPDHVLGAAAVARDFRPRELWEGVLVPPHAPLRELRASVVRAGGATRIVRPDDRLGIGEVELRVLHPPEPDWERQRVRNDDSIVLELRYGDVSIVLPGDIGAAVEDALAPKLSGAPLRVLKAAHHGSATSSSDAWLAAARAAAVIVSCGRGNRYGHPHPSVLTRARAAGAAIFRTDEDGAVTVRTDGTTVDISTVVHGRRLVLTKTTRNTTITKGN